MIGAKVVVEAVRYSGADSELGTWKLRLNCLRHHMGTTVPNDSSSFIARCDDRGDLSVLSRSK